MGHPNGTAPHDEHSEIATCKRHLLECYAVRTLFAGVPQVPQGKGDVPNWEFYRLFNTQRSGHHVHHL